MLVTVWFVVRGRRVLNLAALTFHLIFREAANVAGSTRSVQTILKRKASVGLHALGGVAMFVSLVWVFSFWWV